MAIYIPNNKSNTSTTGTMNITTTSNDTSELDAIIAEIVNLKAQPQSAARDAKIQTLIARRNLLVAQANETDNNYAIASSNDKAIWY